ncbi:MAG: epoxyqueuosine reductase QueH [Paludibacteraceae bacterium]|nr:epoxyqueuosine reductase QueH [Paludibacteraceae bacterium]
MISQDSILPSELLLHCCCAPCSAPILEWLLNNGYKPTLFFYNPNIYPIEEYDKRKNELIKYAYKLGVEFIDGDYDHDEWLKCVCGHESDKERGQRCLLCFTMRLKRTAEVAAERGIKLIATTLASSRWKSIEQIEAAGLKAVASYSDLKFWSRNWRKDGLQERRRILLAENRFYNQTYCGCEFSISL